ncbi:hypothetical protein [Nocardiopsis halophila]|uniref:hypothetical protein n=1 Tax=Nocardiopsis halophila TaxID=141692 RepID=UPI001F4C5324|nr:hypothetical protein [Nocardiopsis halophila]
MTYFGWGFGTAIALQTTGSIRGTVVVFVVGMALVGLLSALPAALPLTLWLNANKVEGTFTKSYVLVLSGALVHIYLAIPLAVPGMPRRVDVPEALVVLPVFTAAAWTVLREQVAQTDTRRGVAVIGAAVMAVVLPVPTAVDGVRARILIANTPAEAFAVPVLDHPDWSIDRADLASGTVSYYNGEFDLLEVAFARSVPECSWPREYCRRHGNEITVIHPKEIFAGWNEKGAVGHRWGRDPAAYIDLGDRWAVVRARTWAMPDDLADTDALITLAETVRLAGPEDHMALARNQQRWEPY